MSGDGSTPSSEPTADPTDVPFSGQASRQNVRLFLDILIPLLILSLLAFSLKIEENLHLPTLLPLIVGGFAIHYWLSSSWQLPFFVLLSLSAFPVILGSIGGLIVVGVGLGLILLCHLPIALWLRIGLLLFAGTTLAALRAGLFGTLEMQGLTAYIGAIFMFRLAVYLYDLQHETDAVSIWMRLGYFFLLPNAVFTLFPVIDYETYKSSHETPASYRTYATAIQWMFRGIVQLVCYRLVYYWITIPPRDVYDMLTLCQHVLSSYLIYLRVSGIFHLSIGMLHLFGLNLPETHHHYFLASNFTDLWRRINIYWKDFMMKLFFYPAFMRFRRQGIERGILLATAWVFFWTTLLHAYQWFWLRGSFVLTTTDALFWTILGVLVAINSVQEARRGRKRSLGAAHFTWQAALIHSVKICSMFIAMCLLWTLWSADTVLGALFTLGVFWTVSWMEYLSLAGILLGIIILATLFQFIHARYPSIFSPDSERRLHRSTVHVSILALIIFSFGLPQWQARMLEPIAEVARSISENRLNRQDAEMVERGYYENLLGKAQVTSQAWDLHPTGAQTWMQLAESGAYRPTGDIYEKELLPSITRPLRFGVLRTNRWGMRDREYDLEKPLGVWRMAHLGVSIPMGLGVNNEDVFEELLELRLNREALHAPITRYESLNFSIGDSFLIQQAALLDDRVLAFQPDAVFYYAHDDEVSRSTRGIIRVLAEVRARFPELVPLFEKAGLQPSMDETQLRRQLAPYEEELVSWSYRRIADRSREAGAYAVWVFWPGTEAPSDPDALAHYKELAEKAGLLVFDLSDCYAGRDLSTVRMDRWDKHPNELGHQLFADRLFTEMQRRLEGFHSPRSSPK